MLTSNANGDIKWEWWHQVIRVASNANGNIKW